MDNQNSQTIAHIGHTNDQEAYTSAGNDTLAENAVPASEQTPARLKIKTSRNQWNLKILRSTARTTQFRKAKRPLLRNLQILSSPQIILWLHSPLVEDHRWLSMPRSRIRLTSIATNSQRTPFRRTGRCPGLKVHICRQTR